MKNTPHPDRTPEAAQIRHELEDQAQALHSLDALAREESSEEIPPIPDELRDQWQERYGLARQAVPLEKESWLSKISKLWIYGGSTALAALVIFISLKNDPATTTTDPSIRMRGGSDQQRSDVQLIVFIPSETISYEAFTATRTPNSTLQASTLDDAVNLLTSKGIESAAILNAANGILHAWKGERLESNFTLEIDPSADEYDLSEALDTYHRE